MSEDIHRALVLAPHHDDETLWLSWTLLRLARDSVRTKVIVCLREYPPSPRPRAWETRDALSILGEPKWETWRFREDAPEWDKMRMMMEAERLLLDADDLRFRVWAPAVEEEGHEQHNRVGQMALDVFGEERVTSYLTYRRGHGRSTSENEVPFEPEWPVFKLQALAAYRSQIAQESTRYWFVDSGLREYYQ